MGYVLWGPGVGQLVPVLQCLSICGSSDTLLSVQNWLWAPSASCVRTHVAVVFEQYSKLRKHL